MLHGGSGGPVETIKGWLNFDWNLQNCLTSAPPTTGPTGNVDSNTLNFMCHTHTHKLIATEG